MVLHHVKSQILNLNFNLPNLLIVTNVYTQGPSISFKRRGVGAMGFFLQSKLTELFSLKKNPNLIDNILLPKHAKGLG